METIAGGQILTFQYRLLLKQEANQFDRGASNESIFLSLTHVIVNKLKRYAHLLFSANQII